MSKGITSKKLDGSILKIGIVVARWNSEITGGLLESCKKGLIDSGVDMNNIVVQEVPGAYEVVFGGKMLIEKHNVDVVVTIGCLIKGETMHFEYIAEAVSQGVMNISLSSGVPVIFGVLTCMTEEQAVARSTGDSSHGYDWGKSAVEMGLLRM
jgi:6,7-dimethyl-8-ribityllumazine synthase